MTTYSIANRNTSVDVILTFGRKDAFAAAFAARSTAAPQAWSMSAWHVGDGRTQEDEQEDDLYSLKTGQTVHVAFSSCMAATKGDGVHLKVGRRSHSKKYNTSSITLEPIDGRKVPSWTKLKLYLRHKTGHVSMAHGDMGVQIHSIKVVDDSEDAA